VTSGARNALVAYGCISAAARLDSMDTSEGDRHHRTSSVKAVSSTPVSSPTEPLPSDVIGMTTFRRASNTLDKHVDAPYPFALYT
jgi:hypothetical protein